MILNKLITEQHTITAARLSKGKGKMQTWKIITVMLLFGTAFTLTGCWQSKKELIPNDQAINPFRDARFILWQGSKSGDKLLERKNGQYEVFQEFNVDPKLSVWRVKFFEVVTLSSYFGYTKYIFGMTNEHENISLYSYLEKSDGVWTSYGVPENSVETSAQTIRRDVFGNQIIDSVSKNKGYRLVNGLQELIDDIDNARSKKRLIINETLVLEDIDSTRAALHKQIAHTAFDEKIRKEKEAAAKAARIKEKQKSLERSEAKAAEASRLARADREPTETEMNNAVRSTLAGMLFNIQLRKLGNCRKAAEYDYYCRYSYLSVNWGNFWKQNGVWYFKIVNN